MNSSLKIIIVVVLLSCVSIGTSLYVFFTKPTPACINLTQVYNDFKYKQEMETKLKSVADARTHILDSLSLQLRVLANSIEREKGKNKNEIDLYQAKREEYLSKEKEFNEDNQLLANQYNEQVLNQLNQYVKDYGKEHQLDYILGAIGDGNVMYISDKLDITKTVTDYVNARYAGK